MAKAAAELEQASDAAGGSQSLGSEFGPVCLDEVLERGATYKGRPVGRITFAFDGGELKLELDPIVEAEPQLTPKQQAVLQVIDEMKIGDVLNHDEMASKAGYANSSDLREFVRRLFEAGRLRPDRRGWKRVK